jgi:2-dehydropantoate 2-reductase
MNIAIVGAGAIGGYLGVKLAQSGVDVTFIARGENLKAIKANGMKLLLEDGSEIHAKNVKASSIDEATPHDYVFLTMKSHQLQAIFKNYAGRKVP